MIGVDAGLEFGLLGWTRPRVGVVKLLSWFTIIAIAATITSVWIWDEELDPMVRVWLSASIKRAPSADNGYVLLMGLFAAPDDSPTEVGAQRAKRYALAMSSRESGRSPEFDDYPADQRLEIGDSLAGLCEVEHRSCLEKFVVSADSIKGLAANFGMLLERYQVLSEYPRFVTTTTPGMHEPAPPLALLMALHRLHNAEVAIEFETGSRLRALEMLAVDIKFLRRLMADNDQLMIKLAGARMLARDLHLYVEFLESPGFVHRYLQGFTGELSDLSQQELGLSNAVRREFLLMADALEGVSEGGEFGLQEQTPDWLTRCLYKPNATLNRIFVSYTALGALSRKSAAEFSKQWQERVTSPPASVTDYFLNPIGTVLSETTDPDLRRHFAVMHDLQGLLRLTRAAQVIRFEEIAAEDVEQFLLAASPALDNPYTGSPFSWNADRNMLGFDGLSSWHELMQVELGDLPPRS